MSSFNDAEDMNTIPDPRQASPANDPGSPSPSQHPDLSNEVATLSTKLINAMNHQTTLDDALSATRQELETTRARVAELEKEAEEHADLVARGFLVRQTAFNAERDQLRKQATEEARLRLVAEKEKKEMEQELENLTTELFEEANSVGAAGLRSAAGH